MWATKSLQKDNVKPNKQKIQLLSFVHESDQYECLFSQFIIHIVNSLEILKIPRFPCLFL